MKALLETTRRKRRRTGLRASGKRRNLHFSWFFIQKPEIKLNHEKFYQPFFYRGIKRHGMWPVRNMDSRHGTSADGPAFPWSSWHLSPDQWCSCYVTDRCRNWYRHRQPPSGKYFFLSLCSDCRHGRCFFRQILDGSFSTASHSFIEMGSVTLLVLLLPLLWQSNLQG